ncbi:uncharacterized protein LOC121369345 [Gigantopelta aegis]|uniref:uncharacterized protein LOC121369345 n=1 Tax=Gigantopelta aegis TaxID=1735272 RepID=UPI001B88804D|nr:uncharacterized protein LOC121369345 [Gigantopelta aegis]XP_041350280.1 uncharacterized protein LOC121369345 [Gigantopelta aegis]XP_041350281.1 uncharacterized protein LOC121369345 [Gigantopelta aegis]
MTAKRSNINIFSVENKVHGSQQTSKSRQEGNHIHHSDGLPDKIHEQLRRHRYMQVLFFIIILGIDTMDFVADWLFYTNVRIAEQGLVYGVPDQKAVTALFFFSIIGSLTFFFETTNLGMATFTGHSWLHMDLVCAVTMWVEDIPQIMINVYISLCREDPISVFQLTKAAVVILGIVIRIVILSVKYCSHDSLVELKQRNPESRRHVTYRVFIMIGLVFKMAGAVTIFILTQTSRDLSGKVIFEVPDTIFKARYHDARYFHNVSVYLHHPTFDYTDDTPNDTNSHWMRLITINSIRNLPEKEMMFDYEFQDLPNELKMILWENDGGSSWQAQECYTLDKSTRIITPTTPCGAAFVSAPPDTSIIFQFSFTPPDRVFQKLIFGDITFNVKINENGTCRSISKNQLGHYSQTGSNIPVVVHYYRTNVSEANHIVNEGGAVRFYENERDLIDIKEVWQNGWMDCVTKGSHGPHYDVQINPPCSTTQLTP